MKKKAIRIIEFFLLLPFLLGLSTALAANKDVPRKAGELESYLVEDDVHIYKGAMVCKNTSGYAQPAADTAGFEMLGIAYEECDNTLTGHSQGGKSVRVYRSGVFKVVATSIAQDMLGEKMYVADDQTVDDASTQMVLAGVLVDYVSATSGWIDIAPAIPATKGVEHPFITKDDDYTVLEEESGSVFAIATDAKVFTLPATKKGLVYIFINSGADGNNILEIDPNAADKILGNDLTGSDGGKLTNTKATAKIGDCVVLVGDGDVGWYITSITGTWAIA